MSRNYNARNFGLGSRDIVKAASNALKERDGSFSTVATNSDRFRIAANFLKENHEIKDLRFIDKAHLISFAEHLKECVDKGDLSISTAHNYVSAVNTVLQTARGDSIVSISSKDYLPPRSFICDSSRALNTSQIAEVNEIISNHEQGERLTGMINLQENLGLRYEESAKIDAVKALAEALTTNKVTISEGTKGGLTREIPITNTKQIEALKTASNIQGSHHSLIPKDLSYAQFRSLSYQAIGNTEAKGYHDLRHTYAQGRYQQIAGEKCPIAANIEHGKAHHQYLSQKLDISVQEAKSLDQDARSQIAEELGHHRIDVTNNYLG